MTVSVVNYDNFSDCFEYRIITIIIITGVTDLLFRDRTVLVVVVVVVDVVGRPRSL